MKMIIMRITLFSLLLFSLISTPAHTATERRTALVIGNSNYADGRLKNPVNDATDIAAALKGLGFTVTLKKDANLREMKDEIDNFGDSLRRGGVGLFFFAGHGIQLGGINYLIPVRAHISNEKMVEHEAFDVNRLLSTLDNAGNSVNIVMLDACRDNPITRSFRSAGRGLAIISRQPPGTLISFSTGANQVAADGDGRNSPYTAALLQHMKTPGLPVEQVFKRVRNKVVEKTRGRQEPAEYTMLREDFYFIPQSSKLNNLSDVPSYKTKEVPDSNAEASANDHTFWNSVKDSKNPDELKAYLEQFPSGIFAPLAHARLKALEKGGAQSQSGSSKVSPVTGPKESGRDGRFIAYDNGTVLDTRTNLMWAAKDNGNNINWSGAKRYCENYRRGGYIDWRLPTQDELAGLYDNNKSQKIPCYATGSNHINDLIYLSCAWVWATETKGDDAAIYGFDGGGRDWGRQSGDGYSRVLPVRAAK